MHLAKPEFLYGLFAIIIPILVHLFQLRKFKIEPFTNTYFLKKIESKNRKSSKLKELLILITRVLTIILIVLAFTKPYKSNSPQLNLTTEIIIYLDNSFSMEAMGSNGELLKSAVQELIKIDLPAEKVSLFTNDNTYKNLTKNELKKILVDINYSNNQISSEDIFRKTNYLFSDDNERSKEFILISDFQKKNEAFNIPKNLSYNLHLISKKPIRKINNFIDRLEFISSMKDIEISLFAKTNSDTVNSINVGLFNDNKIIRRSILKKNANFKTSFKISKSESFLGKFLISDSGLSYDNEFFFNLEKKEKISILEINQRNTNFLKRIFTEDEFKLESSLISKIEYNKFENYDLIILNELNNLPNSLINNLTNYMKNGGSILIVPCDNANLEKYNILLGVEKLKFTNYNSNKLKVTEINFSHPIYKEAFKRKITNFKYPYTKKHYKLEGNLNSLLKFENDNNFLAQANNLFIFTSPINNNNSNFINSPIIVPTIYGIGKSILKQNKTYFEIGGESELDIKYELNKGQILKLSNNNKIFIPVQTNKKSKIKIKFDNIPIKSGYGYLLNENDTIKHLSFNYNRKESILEYHDIDKFNSKTSFNELNKRMNSIKSEEIIDELWKWFVIFALFFLVMEILILKVFK